MTRDISLRGIVDNAIEDLRERSTEAGFDRRDPADAIHEIADGSVPVYTSDLLQLAADNIALATTEPELGPAFDGTPTPTNIIAANIYEHLTTALWDAWQDIMDELTEEGDNDE